MFTSVEKAKIKMTQQLSLNVYPFTLRGLQDKKWSQNSILFSLMFAMYDQFSFSMTNQSILPRVKTNHPMRMHGLVIRPLVFKLTMSFVNKILDYLGLVVQSIVSLTSCLRGHLLKCFTILLPNTLKFFVEKMKELLHCKSISHFFDIE